MFSTWICIADIFHILAKFMMEKFTTKSFSWFICRSCSFLNHWAPVLIPQHTAPQPLLDVSVWIRTCASGLITSRLLQSSKLLTHQSSTFFVMGVCFTKLYTDWEHCLNGWRKCSISFVKYSGVDPLSFLSLPLVMTNSYLGNSKSTPRTLFISSNTHFSLLQIYHKA